ncbi:MAG: hypothetical protein HY744_24270 [Deltaproteobacteria bacterium]|nr:hypothetical protein [Deltaproteobacteria bacterium]
MRNALLWAVVGVALGLAHPACSGDDAAFGPGRTAAGGSGGAGGTGGAGGGGPTATSSSSASSGVAPKCGDGACAPSETAESCPKDCAVTCEHDLCEVGDPLSDGCESCVETVCGEDPYCCESYWDDQCIKEADSLCDAGCCGNGSCQGQSCASCPEDCGECVCGDDKCDGEDCASCADDCGVCPSCPHTVCTPDGALGEDDCRDPCVTAVCAKQKSCCAEGDNPAWTVACQKLALSLCEADPCVTAVCAKLASCCEADWDKECVEQAKALCQSDCDCAHPVCKAGDALDAACEPCAAAVCASDPYCCDAQWDGTCVQEVGSICGVLCPSEEALRPSGATP